jgi:hypothetical protein
VALFHRHFGRAAVHTVIHRTLTAEDQLPSHVGYVTEKSCTETIFSFQHFGISVSSFHQCSILSSIHL